MSKEVSRPRRPSIARVRANRKRDEEVCEEPDNSQLARSIGFRVRYRHFMKMQSIITMVAMLLVCGLAAPPARGGALEGHVDFPAGTFSLDTWTGYVSAKGNGLDEILG